MRSSRQACICVVLFIMFISPAYLFPAESASNIDLSPQLSAAATTKFDYVMILAFNDLAAGVDTLKKWKEAQGFSVMVTDVNQIFALYPTGDDGEKIWNFLHDRYEPRGPGQ